MHLFKISILAIALALLSGCATNSSPVTGLYALQSLTNSGIGINVTATLKLNEKYLLFAGQQNTLSAPVDKNVVGAFTLIQNSGKPLDQFARILLQSLEGSTLTNASNGNLLFIKNDKTVATFAPIPMPDSAATPTGK
ncbi:MULTISPECIES: hypothetical protein [unclassified Lentimonas]|uniref:hypothetical protein n=1 Tax=unclassified Lentimonas TaxID=2630993 RepID=UPI0013296E88|nr:MULTISPECIES: hypothetical protein [unclassified Lentimonas]CAA6690069.1 Unannotated [Lentimonas sp. CC19]CAA6690991.1 Unannotated [Lentimonas sp. CC10]CAA7070681.1 Unannotated [Lentimonas sp. CC11]